MKKIFWLFVFIGCTSAAMAQKYVYEDVSSDKTPTTHNNKSNKIDVNKLRFGAYFAPTQAWMHPAASVSDDGHYHVSSQGSKTGYCWGLVAEYYFAQNYGIATGFNVDLAGGKISSTANVPKLDTTQPNTLTKADMNYKLQYLEIPFALKLRSDELPKSGMRVFGQIGLTAAFNISKKATYDISYKDASGTDQSVSGSNETLKGSLATAPILIQLNVGAGVEYPITEKLYFFTALFFNNGFLPSAINPQNFDLGYKGSFTNPNTRLNSFALRIGLYF